jgi:hypothetical protein
LNKFHEDEIERIYQACLEAIPQGVCYGDILIALSQLAMEFAIVMGEDEDEEGDEPEEPSSYKNGKDSYLN